MVAAEKKESWMDSIKEFFDLTDKFETWALISMGVLVAFFVVGSVVLFAMGQEEGSEYPSGVSGQVGRQGP